MANFIPAPQRQPSFSERLGASIGGGLGGGLNRGIEYAQQLGLQGAKQKKEDLTKFEDASTLLQRMREIKEKGNIGRFSSVPGFFGGETARDRSEFEQLGKSLIPLVAAGVPIRNQREFDEYKKVITDPSSSLDQIEGAINGLERIFSMKLAGKKEKPSSAPAREKPKTMPTGSSSEKVRMMKGGKFYDIPINMAPDAIESGFSIE